MQGREDRNGLHEEEKREVFYTQFTSDSLGFAQTVVTDPGVIENSVWRGLC